MDDLISRKAVLDKFNRNSDMWNVLTDEETSKEFWLFCQVADALDTIPSVPAVPLDKLCEWLNVHCGRPSCCNDRLCGKCNLDGEGFEYETCWETLLTEWMEEQDAAG